MIKKLMIAMIVWGTIEILFSRAYLLTPTQSGDMFGHESRPEYVQAILASLGGFFIAAAVFIMAATRAPLRNISWVKFTILLSTRDLVTELYSVIRGYVNAAQARIGIILYAIFAATFLIFYP